MNDEMRERAYEILYKKYKDIVNKMITSACSLYATRVEAPDDEKLRMVSLISSGLEGGFQEAGFLGKEDFQTIRTLEYIIGERNKVD